ncbi:MAG TPA: hypothetical protein VOA64_16135 [Candidatus Dormibacteraeota bacterium]|nr:hypothetical protein [Candidatus Dormibacteraeota bacterium]
MQIKKNPQIQGAAVALLALNLEYPKVTDKWGDKSGQVINDCVSRLGLPDPEVQKLTPRQEARDVAVFEAIWRTANKMQAALVRARLLSKRN